MMNNVGISRWRVLGGLAGCVAIPFLVQPAAVAQTTTVSRPFLGVVHRHVETSVPRLLAMHLIEIDLDVTGVGFVVTPSNGSAAGETVGRTTRQFAASFGTQVAVNGGFSAWVSGANYAVEGLAASQGVVYSEFQEFRTFALNISQDNVATIVRSVTGSGTSRTPDVPLYNTLPGEARLLRNGTIVNYENESLHPRTAVGLSADDRRLFILTVDGRNPGHSLGVTRPELADFLRMFGAHNAINLDGGGSSTLVFSDPLPRLVNVPVGVNNVPGSERTVGSHFGIYAPPVPPPADVAIEVASGSVTQGQAGHPQLVNALSLTKSGQGTLVLDIANVFAGTTFVRQGEVRVRRSDALQASPIVVDDAATLTVDAGTLTTPRVTLSGGTLAAGSVFVNAATGIGSLVIEAGRIGESANLVVGAGGGVSLPSGSRVAAGVATLQVDESAGGGLVDLGAGQIEIAAGGITAAELRADILAGRNGGGWDGLTGIRSGPAAASVGARAVGYVINADGSARVSFSAPGDANLDGQVDVFDLVSVGAAGAYGAGLPAVWSDGDFNYDGATNVFDLVAVGTGGAYGRGPFLPASPARGGVAVPEPPAWTLATALCVAAGLSSGLSRRAGAARVGRRWGFERMVGLSTKPD
jgi:autotransporter-associated beta strand protein